ncbi:MAG: glycerol-3-phosphate acyltransferase, partial [Tissierellia bacterium]|nr:glycerol-3-phosphate acyltransferase [Tissierellia bacterium]
MGMKLLVVIISYLIGSISPSYIIGKMHSNIDIRHHGSGNAGSTNVLRTMGKRMGALTFLGDYLKGVIAVVLAMKLAGFAGAQIAVLA